LEEDEQQAHEGRRRGKLSGSPSNSASSTHLSITSPLALLPRFCGVLARTSKSAGSCVFRV
jgi:hypothetical protein